MRAIRAVCVARLVCALSASAIAMTGCTSMHRPPAVPAGALQSSSSWRVGRGDVVRITMRDGHRVQFTVQTVDAVAIIAGDGSRYDLADILTVERWRVGRGDVVRITMRDGRRVQFTVQTVDAVAIIAGDGSRYDLADILTVERRVFSGSKTTLLIAGIFEGSLLVAGLLVVAGTH